MRILIGLASIIVLAALGLVIRLAISPLSIGIVTPRLSEVLSGLVSGYRIEIEDTYLFWNRENADLNLSARNVSLVGVDSTVVSVLPRVDVAFNVPILLRGRLAPTAIRAVDAEVKLIHNATGWDFTPVTADSVTSEDSGHDESLRETKPDYHHPFDRALLALRSAPNWAVPPRNIFRRAGGAWIVTPVCSKRNICMRGEKPSGARLKLALLVAAPSIASARMGSPPVPPLP